MEEIDLIEGYYNKTLSESERARFEERLGMDQSFRESVERHVEFLAALKDYGQRKALAETLDEIHDGILEVKPQGKVVSLWKKYMPTLGIAASVAIASILVTYLMLRVNDDEHKANYLELRRNVDRLNKSHNQILENIKADKQHEVALSKYSGTGFLISPSGYIVTSYHVARTADSLFVENEKFGRHKVTLAYGNPETDIAFLLPTEQLSSTPFTVPFAIRSQDANLGETVYTLGYPREDIVYGEGAVSAATGYEQNENSYQISIPVNPGNSGGPMIDGQGSVVGIINGVQTETRSAAFAVKSRVLWDEIKNAQNDSTLTVPMKISNQNQLTNLSRVNQIKKWKDFVFVVKVYHGK